MNISPSINQPPKNTFPDRNETYTEKKKKVHDIVMAILITLAGATTVGVFVATFYVPATLLTTVLIISSIVFTTLIIGKALTTLAPHLPSPIGRTFNIVKTSIWDLMLIPKSALVFFFGSHKKENVLLEQMSKTPSVCKNTPILMIHGFLHNSSAWTYLKAGLEKEGFGPIYTIDLGSPFDSIDTYADRTKEKADLIAKAQGRNDLIIITHSMGGLVAPHFATKHKANVKQIIELGVPGQGTLAANIFSVLTFGKSKAANEMNHKSSFVTNLHKKISESNLNIHHLTSRSDAIIVPNSSASFPDGYKKITEFEDMGHLQYLFSSRVLDTLISELRKENDLNNNNSLV